MDTRRPPQRSPATTRVASAPDARRAGTLVVAGSEVARDMSIYILAMAAALPAGLLTAAVTTRVLPPREFGQLALMTVMAGLLSQIYNTGILHGTFLWVYGLSGDADADLEVSGGGLRTVAAQRTALGTGLVLTVMASTCGTLLFLAFSGPLAGLILGSGRYATLIDLAALCGGSGAMFRLSLNVFRMDRRPRAFAIASIARPLAVIAGTVSFVESGYGVKGALAGILAANLLCCLGCIATSRSSYVLAFCGEDAKQIVRRGSTVVIPVTCLFIVHNADVYLLRPFTSVANVGVYRLASRMGSITSYFASAFLMTWTPIERTPIFAAAFAERGRDQVRGVFLRYYMILGLGLVLVVALGANILVQLAPASYSRASRLIPLVAFSFFLYGAYIVILRTSGLRQLRGWYASTAFVAMIVFVGSAVLLTPAIGSYGPAAAIGIGMCSGSALLLLVAHRQKIRLPTRLAPNVLTFVIAGACYAMGFAGASLPGGEALASGIVSVCLYPLLLWATKVIPTRQVKTFGEIIQYVAHRHSRVDAHAISLLPAGEREALDLLTRPVARPSDTSCARLVRALRRLAGEADRGGARDVQIGRYLISDDPPVVRVQSASRLIHNGVDGADLHQLEAVARNVRRMRHRRWPFPRMRLESRTVESPRSTVLNQMQVENARDA